VIRNITRKTIIAKNQIILNTLAGHMAGLMFKREITPHVLLFEREKRVSLHTFFVSAPIDLMFVNKDNTVVELKENLAPFSLYFPQMRALFIIEAPSGTIRKTRSQINDKIVYNTS